MYPGKWQRAKDTSEFERLLEKVSNDVGGPSKCQKETYEEGKLTNAADEKRLFGDGPFDASANVANAVLQKFNQNVSVVVMPSVN